MFFQISPVKREKRPKIIVREAKPENIEILSLAPFAPAPKLVFDGVKVGETAICKLLMKNPTKQDITIFLSKKLPAELNVSYSWESCTIEKDSEVIFELIWKPINQESSYHKITFDSTRKNFHRDVSIAFKTVLHTKPKDGKKGLKRKSPQKSPTKKYYSTRPPNISSKKYSPSPKTTKTLKTTTLLHPNTNMNQLRGKENQFKEEVNYNNYYSNATDTVERGGTYVFKLNDSQQFNDSLELISPESLQKISTPLAYPRSVLASHNSYDSPKSSYFKQKPSTPLLSVGEDITNYGFEHKLKYFESFCFSPTVTNREPIKTCTEKKDKPPSFYLNTETYITSSYTEFKEIENVAPSPNLSTETYIKSNLSSETYVKGNLSGETYIRDTLEESNLISPTSHGSVTPPLLNDPYITNFNYVKPTGQVLSSIEEESFLHSIPTKRRKCDLDLTANHSKVGGGLTGPKHWSRKGGSAVRISKSSSGLKLTKLDEHTNKEAISQITRRDSNILIIENPFLLAATNMIDPFITPQLYVSDEWIDEQEKDFKKWLNSLLTPPQELLSEDKVVDVAKLWQKCKKREIEAAPTKEDISNKYHVNGKLNNLRKAAQNLFRSKEICDVLSKVLLAVDAGKLSIRQDRYVHLNIAIKSQILSIILSYNPLWLRIGLETIYNEIIPLNSNSDVVGLTTFILDKLFKDPYLIRKHKSMHSPKYAAEFNKFFLKKFLMLVYFLDQAKNRKLIPHNPCLFCKTSNIKDSKELLLILARELLSAVGDITKFLKLSGYVVSHVQTYIHEFDYAVNNLGVDLRDGVRLTKVMELILMKDDLTSNLRVPAISRLQKVHNMKIVFDSLEKSSYKILYDISPKDLVDGHREKTLSFLWQIVYKFEAPLMVKNATIIQTWFRSLPIVLKRRKLQKIKLEKEKAASKIQIWYKRQILARNLTTFAIQLQQYLTIIKIEKATIKIQSFYRMYQQKSIYMKKLVAIKEIQRFSRGWLVRNSYINRIKSAVLIQSYVRMYQARKSYLAIKNSTKTIQLWYRSNKQTKAAAKNYKQLKSVTLFIQTQFRTNMLAKRDKNHYGKLKLVTINIQRRFRANQLCKIKKQNYQKIKLAAINIQNWYRSLTAMKLCRKEFLTLKQSVLNIEKRYIALTTMKKQKETYNTFRKACITIQQRYRAQMAMKIARTQYLKYRTAAVVLQRRFRAKVLMENERKYFKSLKQATVTIQSKYKAKLAMKISRSNFLKTKNALVQIQTWYRATIEMRLRRNEYLSLKNAVIKVENRYKAQILMRQGKAKYQRIRNAVITIQRQFAALLAMRQCKNEYSALKVVAISIQTRFRANRAMKIQRNDYLQLKNTAVVLQRRFKANKSMLECKNQFKMLKNAAVVIQNRYRANQLMKTTRKEYQEFLRCTIKVQILFRAKQLMVRERNNYLELKKVVGNIQTRWKAKKLGEQQKKLYQTIKTSSIIIQQRWRANKLAQNHRAQYNKLRKAAKVIQQRWKAKKIEEKIRKEYVALKTATLVLQSLWRAKRIGETERKLFVNKKNAAVVIQKKFRATLEARIEKRKFELMKKSAITLQIRWRAYQARKRDQQNYQKLRESSLVIQQHWRATIASRLQREHYLKLKKSTITIQKRCRANLELKKRRLEYQSLRKATIFVQQKWRAKTIARETRNKYLTLKTSAIFIQNTWRLKILGRQERQKYIELKSVTIFIQRKWRALKSGKKTRQEYLRLKQAVIFIQQRYRANKFLAVQFQCYRVLKQATVVIQKWYRATFLMKKHKETYTKMKHSSIILQRWYRCVLLAREERKKYLLKQKAAVEMQRLARGYLIRKKYAEYFTEEAREQRKVIKIKNESATRIQAFWKGNKTRNEIPEMKKIRQRYIKASETAVPEKRIHFKCQAALEIFVHTNSTMFHIIKALEDIDYATRRFKNICIQLGKFLPKQLYILLESMTRSLPEMNACISSVNILISFNKLQETRDCSFAPEHIDKLITIMIHWCDKESQLFPSLCTLFWLFAHSPHWKRRILNLANIKQKMEKIKGLVIRKENMVKRQGAKGGSVFIIPGNYLPDPSRTPDWGLNYVNNPFVFTNSVHALCSLLKILNFNV